MKVATRPSQSRKPQTPSHPKPKKQPKTQRPKAESRNLRQRKSRNFNFFMHKQQRNLKIIGRTDVLTNS